MAVSLSLLAGAGWQFFDDNGNPLSGGLLYTYEAGTSTPLATYTDSNGNVANANPIVLDAAGRVPYQVWLDTTADYKFILKTSLGITVWTEDDVAGGLSSAAATFLQAGTGAVARTVQSKLRDVVSVKDFGAVGDGITDDTAAIQAALAASDVVSFPQGTFRISATLNLNRANQSIIGASSRLTEIKIFSTTLSAITLANGVAGYCVSQIKVTRSGTPSAGANGVHFLGTTNKFRRFRCSM